MNRSRVFQTGRTRHRAQRRRGLLPFGRRSGRVADPVQRLKATIVIAAIGLLILPLAADMTGAAKRGGSASTAGTPCRVVSVTDGDTVRLWCPAKGITSARLVGFDTPELFSPRCPSELTRAIAAKWQLRLLLWRADEVTVVKQGTDRYGRSLVRVWTDGTSVVHHMIAAGYGRSYAGGKREGWCG